MPVAGYLLLGGAAVAVLGTLLNWYSLEGVDVNGFTDADDGGRDGPAFVVLAVILAGFGVTLLAAKRVLAVAILAVVFASFVVLAGFADFSDLNDRAELVEAFGGEVDIGPGIPVVIVGGLVALAGGIVALATRRR